MHIAYNNITTGTEERTTNNKVGTEKETPFHLLA